MPACSQANPYVDMASLSALAKYTTGSVHYTPGFTPQTHAVKVQHEIVHNLTRTTGEPNCKCRQDATARHNLSQTTGEPIWNCPCDASAPGQHKLMYLEVCIKTPLHLHSTA